MKVITLLSLLFSLQATAKEILVYSARNEQLIKPLFDLYKKETGVEVKFVTDKEGPLMQKLKAEGENSQADILLTVDAGNLWQASSQGLLKPIESKILMANVPSHLRDPNKTWFGMSVRARTIFYNKEKVKPDMLSSYEDLADPKWKKKLCLRTSNKVYNQSLVAMMISELGEDKAQKIVAGWVNNLSTTVFPDDTKLLEAIDAGLCDVGIANTYYYGRLLNKKPDLKVGLFWANQKGKGVHVNISGAGVTKYSKNEKEAIKFLEWLSSEKAQNLLVDEDMEYPVNAKVTPTNKLKDWGNFKHNLINVSTAGELQARAVMLMDRAQYK